MGLDVMSRSVRVRYAMSTSPSPSARSKSLDADKSMSDGALSKSLTPNRKHHKLLKDGSEVWSEDVEKIFVEGLKQYWESPWATYSRGRSRWRNQFLVEHLKKNGIDRSKKQVASHIQVLRNMWRGEPEFHLVAGGEELFQENGLLNASKPNGNGGAGGSSSSPDALRERHSQLAPPDALLSDYASAPPDFAQPMLPPPHQPSSSIRTSPSYGGMYAGTGGSAASSSSLAAALGTPPPSPHAADRLATAPITLEPLHMGTGLFALPPPPPTTSTHSTNHPPYLAAPATTEYAPPPAVHNRVLGLSLWADGMPVYTLDIDRLAAHMALPPHSPQLPSVLLRTRVALDPAAHSNSPAGLRGAVTLAARWRSEAKCITTLYAGQAAVGQKVGFLDGRETAHIHQPDALTHQSVTCTLPESALSSCKWLETDQDLITQQIVIDGVVLAAFVYHLERTVSRSGPSAELIGAQRYRPTVRRRTASQPVQQFTPPRSPVPLHQADPAAYFPTSTFASPLVPQAATTAYAARPPGTVAPPTMSSGMLYSATPSAGLYGGRSPAVSHYYPTS